MTRKRNAALGLLVVCLLALAPAGGASAAKPGGTTSTAPSSMSALGDSITKAFNACGWFFDCTERSWASGTYSGVNSHYLRILAKNNRISGRNYNDAVSGAKIADLPGQATNAANRGVEYVTILMGANDACTSSEANMTPVETYRSHFTTAMQTLATRLPNAKFSVVSVPDIQRLWFIGKDSSSARNAWSAYGICQSMLANPQSTDPVDVDRRARVRQRVIDFNTVLASVCAQYANCRFDNNAAFNYPFLLSHMSTWDYFHPNTEGQRVLADVSYRNTWNF
ncbi:MAG TPA: SGNH/GDSL hydrolase family protein [Acidimicrobiales bacterium]